MPISLEVFVLIVLILLSLVAASKMRDHRNRTHLRQKMHASVGAWLPEDTELNPTSRTMYEMENGEYKLDANGKRIRAHDITGRVSKQTGLFQPRNGANGEPTIFYTSDAERMLILDRKTTDTFERNRETWRRSQFLDEMTDATWEGIQALHTSLSVNGNPTSPNWVNLLHNLYIVGHNLIFKQDTKEFKEPALLFVENANNGKTLMAVILSTGVIKVPTTIGHNTTWTDYTLDDAVRLFTPLP